MTDLLYWVSTHRVIVLMSRSVSSYIGRCPTPERVRTVTPGISISKRLTGARGDVVVLGPGNQCRHRDPVEMVE
jgi:hypothetical protein